MATNDDILATATPQVRSDEGCAKRGDDGKLYAYPDPLSGGDPWTIGYGATGTGIAHGTCWTQDEADQDLDRRLDALCASLDTHISWWRNLDAVRAAVLVNMSYNMGVQGLLGFPHMLACVKAGDWAGASVQMLDSTWAKQLPGRSGRLAKQMKSGSVG